MSDVMEALKLLESIGTEYSRTRAEILDAAGEVARKIVALSVGNETRPLQIAYAKKWVKSGAEISPRLQETGFADYWIDGGKLLREIRELRKGQFVSSYKAVDESEELARLFASDIGHGLLGQMYETLLEQNEKAQSGLAVLKAAAKIFAGK